MRFRVHMHSKPSPGWEFYDGHVDVDAESVEEAGRRAIDRLARGAFRDRGRDAWIITSVTTKGGTHA